MWLRRASAQEGLGWLEVSSVQASAVRKILGAAPCRRPKAETINVVKRATKRSGLQHDLSW